MRRLAIVGVLVIAGGLGLIYVFIRAPYLELSSMISAAPDSVQPEMLRSAFLAAEEPRERLGATFTDQLVKYATTSRKRGLERIAQAIILRLALDARFDRERILATYAERVYLGPDAYGIHEGAEHYFGKPPSALTTGEAATLASLVRSPRYYSPRTAPDRALLRRNLVLREMAARGLISEEQLRVALAEPLRGRG